MKNFRVKDKVAVAVSTVMIAVFYLVFHCPFRFFFGVSCPGCGFLRACLSLLKFDFVGAFYYHPLVFLVFPAAVYLLLRFFKKEPPFGKKVEKVLTVTVIVLFAVTYVYRLCIGHDVVKPDFSSSVLHKIITLILGAISND